METFKDIERENKTKPHSKQGLSAEEKLDPREKEKAETLEWLNVSEKSTEVNSILFLDSNPQNPGGNRSDRVKNRIFLIVGYGKETRKRQRRQES